MVERLERVLWNNYKIRIKNTLDMVSKGQVKVNGISVPVYKKTLRYDTRRPNTIDLNGKKVRIPIRT